MQVYSHLHFMNMGMDLFKDQMGNLVKQNYFAVHQKL